MLGVALGCAFAQSATTALELLQQLDATLVQESLSPTELTLAAVSTDPKGTSFPLTLVAGEQVLIVATGDPAAITDLDLWIVDRETGEVLLQDDLDNNVPVIAFTAPAAATYELRVLAADLAPEASWGYFALAVAEPSEAAQGSSAIAALDEAVRALEAEGYAVYQGHVVSMTPGVQRGVSVWLPPANHCLAVAVGGPGVRRLDLYAGSPWSSLIDVDQRNGPLGILGFPAQGDGEYVFVMEPRKARGSSVDAALVVGCRN